MSFTQPSPVTPRLTRSELAVPASSIKFFEKAAQSKADLVFLDLEDAVAPDDKVAARRNAIAALNDVEWGAKTIAVRINGLDTHYMYRDVVDVVEACPRLDLLVIPKVGVPADLYALDMLVTQIEQAHGRVKRIGFEILIETALGMANVEAIAQASPRLEAMCFGAGDYAASTGARTTHIGGLIPHYGVLSDRDPSDRRTYYPTDPWHGPQARVLAACRAYGLRAIDGVYGDFKDAEGFRSASERVAALGYEGKWAIHPTQIEVLNGIFSPGAEEIARARRIVEAMAEAARAGKGAVQLDGRLVDIANIRMAQNVLRKAQAMSGSEQTGPAGAR